MSHPNFRKSVIYALLFTEYWISSLIDHQAPQIATVHSHGHARPTGSNSSVGRS